MRAVQVKEYVKVSFNTYTLHLPQPYLHHDLKNKTSPATIILTTPNRAH